jgi:hypothetical protein
MTNLINRKEEPTSFLMPPDKGKDFGANVNIFDSRGFYPHPSLPGQGKRNS